MDSGFEHCTFDLMCDSVKNDFFPFWNIKIYKLLNQVAMSLVKPKYGNLDKKVNFAM